MPPHPAFYTGQKHYIDLSGFDDSYVIAACYEAFVIFLKTESLSLSYTPKDLAHMRTGGISIGKVENLAIKFREDCRIMKTSGLPARYALALKIFLKSNSSCPNDRWWGRWMA